jgi:hypothetical protein
MFLGYLISTQRWPVRTRSHVELRMDILFSRLLMALKQLFGPWEPGAQVRRAREPAQVDDNEEWAPRIFLDFLLRYNFVVS